MWRTILTTLLVFILSALHSTLGIAQDKCANVFSLLEGGFQPKLSLQSLIEEAGLGSKKEMLERLSGEIIDAHEFIQRRREFSGAYLLGTDGFQGVAKLYSAEANLKHWTQGYPEMGVYKYARNRTDDYLSKITATDKKIVFFVDPSNGEKTITREELDWLLAHPEKLKNVTFVFGAYHAIPETVLREWNRTRSVEGLRKYFDGVRSR